jgi:sporulation protein YlmC with PRC-barrel domain
MAGKIASPIVETVTKTSSLKYFNNKIQPPNNHMKRKMQSIITTAAASLLAFSALAQDTTNQKMGQPDYSRQRMIQPSPDQLNGAAKASDLIGMTVNNYQNEKLGKVENLAVDVESGRIVQVIISTGGFLGMGNSLTAVPPGALHHDVANKVLHLDVSKERFNAAPKFDTAKWEDYTQSNRVTQVYSYYGEQPYFVGDRDDYGTNELDGTLAGTLPRNMDGTINTIGARTMDTVHNREIASNSESVSGLQETNNTITTRNPDGTWTQKYQSNHNGLDASSSSLGYVQKGSKLMGTSVRNLQNEKLGNVDNFVVDLSSSRIVAVIISTGGFLGMGDELSAVPPTALEYNAVHDALQLDTSKETLASAPHFKPNQWPDLNQPGYFGGVYRAYDVDPYFTTGANTSADNTRRNVRDRDSRALTPLDQGNSQADINTTKQIRKEIIANKEMSTNAKNVKIMTADGRVTLRGPVNTTEEKNLIGEIANRIAQSANVDNQLEVQIKSTSY